MSSLNLLDLPSDVRRIILAKNASDHVREHFKVRAVCRTLCADADHVDTHSQINLIQEGPSEGYHRGIILLYNACLDANNVSARFLKAISDFMYTYDGLEAFHEIKDCVIAGCKPAVYWYEVIRRFIFPHFERYPWLIGIVVDLAHIRDTLDAIVNLRSCLCSVYRYWLSITHENVKGINMCNSCFWNIESSVFFKIIAQTFLEWLKVEDIPPNGGWGEDIEQNNGDWGQVGYAGGWDQVTVHNGWAHVAVHNVGG